MNLIIISHLLILKINAFLPSHSSSFGTSRYGIRLGTLFSSRDSTDEMYWEKYSGGSKEEQELKRMAYLQQNEDSYYGGKMNPYRFENDEDYFEDEKGLEDKDYYDGEEYELEEDEDELPDPGNYWSNPKGGMDRPVRTQPRTNRVPNSKGFVAERRRRPPAGRRSSIRYGSPPPPKPAKDFYERLFWYGFDPDDSEGVGDKTVFGGTKGKFNGLSYISATERGGDPRNYRRQLPPSRRAFDDYYEDEDVIEDGDDAQDYYEISSSRLRSVKPPNDRPYPRSDPSNSAIDRRRKRKARPDYIDDEYDDSGNWISKSVSSWFGGDDGGTDFDNRTSRRESRKTSSLWSPFNVVDAFFGVDRDEMKFKADLYNAKMGLDRDVLQSRRSRSSQRKTPRRPGYAYQYEGDEEDDSTPVLDISSPNATEETPQSPINEGTSTDAEGWTEPSSGIRKRERTWEERALAVEQVPPDDTPAWGPSGELPYDARTKAIMDALEDVQTARRKLDAKEKKEALAREEITILKVEAELERRKLEAFRGDPGLAQDQLRQIDFELDEASRDLRRARTQVQLAREQLERLQDRHWALLGFYNPDKAKEQVDLALKELEETEPAARLDDGKANDTDTLQDNIPSI